MDLKEKIVLIQQINEADLREKVLVPLFLKMGYIDPLGRRFTPTAMSERKQAVSNFG